MKLWEKSDSTKENRKIPLTGLQMYAIMFKHQAMLYIAG